MLVTKRIIALLLTVAGALVTCSAAFANALTNGHGSNKQPGSLGQFTPPTTGHAGGVSGGTGTLPFTGLNLAIVAAIAVLLLATGLVLHRMTRRQQ